MISFAKNSELEHKYMHLPTIIMLSRSTHYTSRYTFSDFFVSYRKAPSLSSTVSYPVSAFKSQSYCYHSLSKREKVNMTQTLNSCKPQRQSHSAPVIEEHAFSVVIVLADDIDYVKQSVVLVSHAVEALVELRHRGLQLPLHVGSRHASVYVLVGS